MALFKPGELESHGEPTKQFRFGGVKIKIYPSRPWNCQICCEEGDELKLPYLPDVVIRHFTGRRKSAMEAYARDYLDIRLEEGGG